jgi:hypothetical protein
MMKHFKSPDGELFAFELDGSQDHLIPGNFVLLTPAQYETESLAKQKNYIDQISAIPLTAEQIRQRRNVAFVSEADPLFFKAQRGEATIEEWQAKVAEIRARYPYPEVQ